MKAIWNNEVIAESDDTVIVEGNHYFLSESVTEKYLNASQTTTVCHWKGVANYYTLAVNGVENPDAAWVYRTTQEAAKKIEGRIAFWKGVQIVA